MLRRDMLAALAAALAAAPTLLASGAQAHEPAHQMPPEFEAMHARNDQIVMLLYPQMTALDLVGPQYMFGNMLGAKVHLLAARLEPVPTDTGFSILPTGVFADAPPAPQLLFVPGGASGTLAAMQDPGFLQMLTRLGHGAEMVSSVCTGSLLLAAAGLLTGYRATSHWLTRDLLPLGGAEPVDARVVQDRNRITGAGVSAGLDLGLAVTARMRGPDYAQAVQLLAEYAPEPPFTAGTPAGAGPATTRLLTDMFADFRTRTAAALTAARHTRRDSGEASK